MQTWLNTDIWQSWLKKSKLIALSETGRDNFSDSVLKNFSGGRDYIRHIMAPHGRSGGILLGVDLNYFDIGATDEGDFYVEFILRDKSDGFKFALCGLRADTIV